MSARGTAGRREPPHYKYRRAFGATLMPAAWHQFSGLSASAWIDFVGGRSLPANNTPVVGSDETNFRGRLVAKTAVSGSSAYRGAAVTAVYLNGSRPHTIWVGRDTVASYAGASSYYSIGVAAVTNDIGLSITGTALTANFGIVSGPTVADTSAHRIEYMTSATVSTIVVDSTTFNGSSVVLGRDETAVAIGCGDATASAFTTTIHGGLFCFSQALSATQLALFRQFCLQDFGV